MNLERMMDFLQPSINAQPKRTLMAKQRTSITWPEVRFFAPRSKCKIMEIVLTKDHMVLHMVHHADSIYINGGWVRIHPEIFIRPSFTENIYRVKRVLGVPVYPDQHEYTSKDECLMFTLIFPRLPDDTISFDLIEKEPSDDSFFNFYGVKFNSNHPTDL
jgi:hypothetical protein